MAKIIENVYENVLKEGKKILLEDGYQKMTLRLVASRANIATGTIYNYFPSKDVLVAKIMWEDWLLLSKKLNDDLANVSDLICGIERIFMMLKEYTSIYELCWKDYKGSIAFQGKRHNILIQQLSDYLNLLFKKFNVSTIDNLDIFLSEVILNGGSREDTTFDDIKPFILKLLN